MQHTKKHLFLQWIAGGSACSLLLGGISWHADAEEQNGWIQRAQDEWQYIQEDGQAATGLITIDGTPYRFSPDGFLETGWQSIGGKRYYYDPELGTPQYGWVSYRGSRYYVTEEQGKLTGFQSNLDGTAEQDHPYYFSVDSGQLQLHHFQDAEGNWYYADDDGVVQTGTVLIDGVPYQFDAQGVQTIGWVTIDQATYYYAPEDGTARLGWLEQDGVYYYLTAEHGLEKGEQLIDGIPYPLDAESGALQTGFYTAQDGATRYYQADGTVATGFLQLEDAKYYFKQDGTMWTGWLKQGETAFFFGEDGKACLGWQQIDGATYYFDSDGCAVSGWQTLDGQRYHFGNDHTMTTGMHQIGGAFYCFSEDGLLQTGWQTDQGNWYYFQEDGTRIATGWQTIDAEQYYFFGTGRAAVGVVPIDGKQLYFSPETRALVCNQTLHGVTTDSNGEVQLVMQHVTYLSQEGYPTGCESASAVMLLQHYGYAVTIAQFIDQSLDRGELYTENGVLYGPHPSQAFIGSPYYSSGYGCYAPVIVNAMNRILQNGDLAYDLTGTSLSGLCTNYLEKGQPVLIWATINMVQSTPGTKWVIPETGELFTWKRSEHCLVLVGYDAQYYYMNDPYQNNGLKAYDRSLVEARYATMGYQAVAILQEGDAQ